ncbi:putative glycolipid-binding domain-containing protein [Streptomyces sp. NPDC007861]|uniref:putative glycolipid-binding domain-containing protein n=1 Tax=Streptomyces sp. NPDC007861 TaxID=3154893 RepID=UPI003402DBF1
MVNAVSLTPPPSTAAWRHQDTRAGFAVACFQAVENGWHIDGYTSAWADGGTFAVEYAIELDTAWRTMGARIRGRSPAGPRSTVLATDGSGHWQVDGEPAPHLGPVVRILPGLACPGTHICRVVVSRRLPRSPSGTGGAPTASTPSSALQLHAPGPAR